MPSIFHVTTSVCAPDRATVGLAANVKVRPVVEQSVTPGSHVAICWKDTALSVPETPVARVHTDAFHVTSLAAHVVAPTIGGVNEAAAACTLTFNCLVADDRTIRSTV